MSARDKILSTLRPGSVIPGLLDTYRTEVLAEVATWLVKKAREFRAEGQTVQSDTASILASKVERGAVRPDNLRMLPADFFEPGRTYTVNEPFAAPEIRPHFQCVAVAIHPTTGKRRAFGFEQRTANAPWTSASLRDEEWADGWVDVTEAGAV
ncbi:hypothetical protein ACFYQA_08530 [Streptomyces sp. NPDC005774]|uniref:hypothetical protein n=1 Tax=Streptomyces sp. NPDC005774 TaxID=3364728 RepID=UPI0036A5E963